MTIFQFLFGFLGIVVLILVGLASLGHPVMAPVALETINNLVSSGSSPDTLYQSAPMKVGSSITSLTGGFVLANNATGTLTLSNAAKTVVWSTGAADTKPKTLSVNPIGQAVLAYDDGTTPAAALNAGVAANGSYYLKIGADGTLAVYDGTANTVLNTIYTPTAPTTPAPVTGTPGAAPVGGAGT